MRRFLSLLLTPTALFPLSCTSPAPSAERPSPPSVLLDVRPGRAPLARANGYNVQRDPGTGRFVPGSALQFGTSNSSSTGLTEQTVSTGGAIVRLNGRFRSSMTAAIDEAGKLHTNCGDSADPNHQHASLTPAIADATKEEAR